MAARRRRIRHSAPTLHVFDTGGLSSSMNSRPLNPRAGPILKSRSLSGKPLRVNHLRPTVRNHCLPTNLRPAPRLETFENGFQKDLEAGLKTAHSTLRTRTARVIGPIPRTAHLAA
jgi:hypothetical protein